MSDYLDIFFKCELKADVDENIIAAINYVISPDAELKTPPTDENWNGQVWKNSMPRDENQDDVFSRGIYRLVKSQSLESDTTRDYTVYIVQQNLHDDGWANTTAPFLMWLVQYTKDGFVGYYNSYSTPFHPILLYISNGKLCSINQDEFDKLPLECDGG